MSLLKVDELLTRAAADVRGSSVGQVPVDRGASDSEFLGGVLDGYGYSVKDIAKRIHLASGIVRSYLSSSMQKTGAITRYDAARLSRSAAGCRRLELVYVTKRLRSRVISLE